MESSNDQAVILIAEGKDSVRKTVQFMLQSHGYVPLTAYAAAAALDISRRRPGRADLLPSDVRMLGSMNSVALARELTREWAGIRVILMSGKVTDAADVEAMGLPFLSKPFTASKLRETMRRVL